MSSKKLIVLSFDALSKKDFELFSSLPNFKKLLKESSFSKNVKSINPTLTYACHTSIITGCHPIKTGVYTNTKLQPNRLDSPDWYWHRKYIKRETLYDLARKNGLKVASILWPVTAGADIKWNLPEIWPNRKWQTQEMVSAFSGSLKYQLELNNKFGHIRDGKKQPNLDDFTLESLIYTLEKYNPDILLAHFIDLDDNRHRFGHDSKEALDSIKRLDERLGKILKFLDEKKRNKETIVVVLGDHAQIPVNMVISLNTYLEKNGLLTRKGNNIKNYKVISKANDGSIYIYCKDKSFLEKTKNILEEFTKNNSSAIRLMIEKDEIISRGMDPEADFVLDANQGYYFTDSFQEKYIEDVKKSSNKAKDGYLLSSHGFLNDSKDYETVFIIRGQGIKKNYEFGEISLVDEAPTMAKILGFNMENVDGKIIEEIFI